MTHPIHVFRSVSLVVISNYDAVAIWLDVFFNDRSESRCVSSFYKCKPKIGGISDLNKSNKPYLLNLILMFEVVELVGIAT
jgi:hypothetical protein